MTAEHFAAIVQRAAEDGPGYLGDGPAPVEWYADEDTDREEMAFEDRAALLAEVERLRRLVAATRAYYVARIPGNYGRAETLAELLAAGGEP